MTTIDVHCHLATPASRELIEPHRRPEYEPYDYHMGQDSKEHNKVMFPGIVDQLTDPAARLEHMDRMGVDIQGLATFVSEYFYWAPATAAASGDFATASTAAANLRQYAEYAVTAVVRDALAAGLDWWALGERSACTHRPPTSSTAAPPRACAHRRGSALTWLWSVPPGCSTRTTSTTSPASTSTTWATTTASPKIRP